MESVSPLIYDQVILIGRFQTPEIHIGYQYLFSQAESLSSNVDIYITTAEKIDDRNPLSYDFREDMIQRYFAKYYPDVYLRISKEIGDKRPTNDEWVEHVCKIAKKNAYFDCIKSKILLLSGRDGFLEHVNKDLFHRNGFYTYQVPNVPGISKESSTKKRNSTDEFKADLWKKSDDIARAYGYGCIDQTNRILNQKEYVEINLLDLDGNKHPLTIVPLNTAYLGKNLHEIVKKLISSHHKNMEWDKSTLDIRVDKDGNYNAYFAVNWYEPGTLFPQKKES